MNVLRKIVNWTVSAALPVGILYSALALNAKVVYASSCNCTEEKQDAEAFCSAMYGQGYLAFFQCPVDGTYYGFVCGRDPSHTSYLVPCD